jgi:hypothetical protein
MVEGGRLEIITGGIWKHLRTFLRHFLIQFVICMELVVRDENENQSTNFSLLTYITPDFIDISCVADERDGNYAFTPRISNK